MGAQAEMVSSGHVPGLDSASYLGRKTALHGGRTTAIPMSQMSLVGRPDDGFAGGSDTAGRVRTCPGAVACLLQAQPRADPQETAGGTHILRSFL